MLIEQEQDEFSETNMFNNNDQNNYNEQTNEIQSTPGFDISIVSLPDEVFAAILEFFSFGEVLDAVCRVCHAFKDKVYSSIRSLYISREKTKFSRVEELFTFMDRFTHLKNVKIKGFHNLTDDALSDILTTRSTLGSLHVKDCTGIISPDFEAKFLNYLKLEWTRRIQSISIKSNTLTVLEIEHPGQTDFDKVDLNCPNLEKLCISNSNISDASISRTLNQISGIRELTLEFCNNIKSPSIDQPSLRTLNLSATSITDNTLKSILKKTPSLQELNLTYCSLLRKPRIESNMLKILRLSECQGLRRNGLEIICPVLEELYFNSSIITDASVQHTVTSLPSLWKLNLRWCLFINNPVIMNRSLTELDLSYSKVDNTGLQTVLKGAPNLTTLRMYECPKLTQPVFNNTCIRFLDISCTNITDHSVEQLFKGSVLEEVWMNWCNRLVRPTIISSTLRHLRMVNCERLVTPVIICEELEVVKMDFCLQLEKPFIRCNRPELLRWSNKSTVPQY